MRFLILAALVCGCYDRVADTDEAYYAWDGRRSLCGIGLDNKLGVELDDIRDGIERARDRDEVLVFYAHSIGKHLSEDKLEAVLSIAQELGVEFYTFPELAGPVPEERAGIALTFDDAHIESWYDARDLFEAYGARATFFVTRFYRLNDERVDALRELYADGHAIESHGQNHLHAPGYAEDLGVAAYVEDEVVPSLEAMREAGFAPTTFAYPFGARTGELDRAILEHVDVVRSLSWLFASNGLIQDPCAE